MIIDIVGFGHFAGVVASCLFQKGHRPHQLDFEPWLLRNGQQRAEDEQGYVKPEWSPGEPAFVWVAYNVPLNVIGEPVIDEVLSRIQQLDERYATSMPFVVSCQWPVGTFAKAEQLCPGRPLIYVMENVRVGHAIADLMSGATMIVGTRSRVPDFVTRALHSLTNGIVHVTPESAEMAKHATNAFMALQIAFINEIAALSKRVGAVPEEVACALREDWRVNGNAPLEPGAPFGGGSLLRDLKVISNLLDKHFVYAPILEAIELSNNEATR